MKSISPLDVVRGQCLTLHRYVSEVRRAMIAGSTSAAPTTTPTRTRPQKLQTPTYVFAKGRTFVQICPSVSTELWFLLQPLLRWRAASLELWIGTLYVTSGAVQEGMDTGEETCSNADV